MAATDRARLVLVLIACPLWGQAATLPEDRADILYHGYEGGGLEVVGPSVLVRKAYQDKISIWANYYVDMISSASIDVVTTASEYSETRTEKSLGFDYLHDRTTMSLAYTNSEEGDYSANVANFGISQSFFGDLTTLGVGYGRGWDEVRRNGDEGFAEELKRQNFRVDLSQIITPNLILSLNYEGVTDQGFLNNPYRQVRYLDPGSPRGYSYELERYPGTKTSSAFALRGLYYLPYRAALRAEHRRYTDSWGIEAWNGELGYVHPLVSGFVFDLRYRHYDQGSADFYSDLFDRSGAQNFLARDKELASFSSHTVGAGVSYEFTTGGLPFFTRGEASLFLDWIRFDYGDFRDARVVDAAPGSEPLYGFDAYVVRAWVSFWY